MAFYQQLPAPMEVIRSLIRRAGETITVPMSRDKNAPLRQQIYEALKGEILSGALRAGQTLLEEELATRYGTSRTPVREVLTTLSHENLIRQFPRRGYQVIEFRLDDVLDVFQVRMLLEPEAAYRAAGRSTPEELDRLEAIAREMVNAERPGQANVFFHRGVAALSGNRLLADLVEQLNEKIWLFGKTYLGPLDPVASDQAHFALIAALRCADAESARAVMQEHLRQTESRVRRTP